MAERADTSRRSAPWRLPRALRTGQTSAVTSGGPTYTYGYDKDSNRITDAAGTHTFNAANQLTDTGTTYDADGNLTVSSAFPTLTYNGIDQTTAITPAGQALVPFTYAGSSQSERTSAATTTAQNGALGVQSETTSGATTSYVSGPGGLLLERSPGGDFYYYFDGLGSVIGLVDATTGNQRAAYTYDPYGSNATATAVNGTLPANPWRFAGGYLDATTGLYHFGARYYDPVTGRFAQQDPVGGGYVYASGDPVNRVDPSGLADFQPIAIFEELCGFGAGYYPGVVGTTTCVNYRNARVTGIADYYYYYYYGAPRPVQHDFDRAIHRLSPTAQYVASCAATSSEFASATEGVPYVGVLGGAAVGCLVGLATQYVSSRSSR